MVEHVDTGEKGFQKLIVKELVEKQGYVESASNDFDREFCLNVEQLMIFIRASQPDAYETIQKKGERAFLARLDDKLKKEGLVEVLRKGVKHFDKTVDLFYPQPSSVHNVKDQQRYAANIFAVTQELVYTGDNKNRLDLVIFVNGLPLITMELKNAFTHQAVGNAIRQYQNDRSPKDKIFNFGRCLVHFAADTDHIYMTTELQRRETTFMPFNKGLNDGRPSPLFGAGNPSNPGGLKTAYLWQEILTKDSLANIIEKYAHLEVKRDPETKKVNKRMIFPRYHQLTVVRQLLAHAKASGLGRRYLIQHSAGSGKSNSITWLALQLVGLYDQSNIHPLFNSVVVVTDRTNLDEQLRENIKTYAQNRRIYEAITGHAGDIKALDPTETSASKTTHMRLALENNKRIISCTVQTFPFVLQAVQAMPGKTIAFIIDEAHSSQSGQAAASMNAVFSDFDPAGLPTDEEGNISTEDLLNYLMDSHKMLKTASYFAFTATPKNKTLETFGSKQRDGQFVPFHTYSMKQAIEEEFILDVLQNYTTYQSYYRIRGEAGAPQEKEYETQQAHSRIKGYVEGHYQTILEKAQIMIDHFHQHVRRRINNQARAMVITQSIEAAMKYKDAFDNYLKQTQSPYKAIVAYSGKKRHYQTGQDMSEADMNNFPDGDNNIPRQFRRDPYRFLIVANKYQTGFDEPLLHTMYVDKLLADVQAVQALSRLNRAYKPHKKDTFVLDFYNKVDDIKEAFEPYYTTTILSQETDVNKLNDLQDDLDNEQVYHPDDVEEFFTHYYAKEADRSRLESIIDRVVADFEAELDQDRQIAFKSNAKSFVRTYSYLAKLLDFNNPYWQKLWLFLKFLIPKLRVEDDEPDENILEAIDLESYRISRTGSTSITLDDMGGVVDPIPVKRGGLKPEPAYDTLENIVTLFNQRFGDIDWGEGVDAQEAEKILVGQIPDKMEADEETLASIKNSDKDNARITSDEKVIDLIETLMFTHTEIYKKFKTDPDFKKRYQDFVFDVLWEKAGNPGRPPGPVSPSL